MKNLLMALIGIMLIGTICAAAENATLIIVPQTGKGLSSIFCLLWFGIRPRQPRLQAVQALVIPSFGRK